MAFAPPPAFVDYAPNDQGPGYYFKKPDGQSVLSYGPAAEQLKASIDASRPPDARVASNAPVMGPPGAGMGDWIRGQSDAQANDAMRAQLAPAPVSHDIAPAAPQAPSAQSIMNAPNALRPDMRGAAQTGQAVGEAVTPPAGVVSSTPPQVDQLPVLPGAGGPGAPGSSGVTVPGYLTQPKAGKAGFRPTTQHVETEGGVEDPTMRRALGTAYKDQIEADDLGARDQASIYRAQMSQAQAQQAAAQRAAQRAQDQVIRGQALQAAATKEFNDHVSVAQKDLDAESKREVDQYRLFKGKPGAYIGALISTIAGGFLLGAQGRASNPGLDAVNQEIDRDVQAQRDEILRGYQTKQNDLSRIRDKYGVDTDEASRILNLALTQKAAAVAQAQAGAAGNLGAQTGLVQLNQSLAQRRTDILRGMATDIYGKHKSAEDSRYSAGGSDPLTMERRKSEYIRLQGENAVNDYKATHGGQAPPKSGGASNSAIAGPAAAVADVQSNAARFGLEPDANNPAIYHPTERTDEGTGKLGRAKQWLGEAFGTDGAQEREQAIYDVAKAGATNPRGAVDHELLTDNMRRLHGANSPKAFAQAYSDIARRAVVMKESLGNGGGGAGGYSEGVYDGGGGGEGAPEGPE